MKNITQTRLLLLVVCCGITMVAAKETVMPLIFHAKDNALSFKDDIYSTQSDIISKFVNSLNESQAPSETVVITIRTPESITGTFKIIKQRINLMPALQSMLKENFVQSISYDASSLTQELVQTLDSKNINMTVSQVSVELSNFAEIESAIKQASQSNSNIFVIFTEDANATKLSLAAKDIPKGRKLQDANYNPTMLQIPSETLYGLILTFLLFLPLLYIGISMLYGIQTPEKFATMNLVVGREY